MAETIGLKRRRQIFKNIYEADIPVSWTIVLRLESERGIKNKVRILVWEIM